MSRELMPYSGGSISRDTRRAARHVAAANYDAQVAQARIDAKTDIAQTAIEDYTHVVGQSLNFVARVGQLQMALATESPISSARLDLIASKHTMTLESILGTYENKLRRLL